MHRKLIGLAAFAFLAGCQGENLQNTYAAIGPATVPPPGMKETAEGYYTPPPATPTIGGTTSPAAETAAAVRPSLAETVRTEIGATPRAAASTSISTEPPIRIVEAEPAATPKPIQATSQPSSSIPIREPAAVTPGVVSATPLSSTSSADAPAIKFNPSAASAELSQLPRPPATAPANAIPTSPSPALNRTRGFGAPATVPSIPATPTPKNRLSTAPGMLRDPYVRPATFVETTTATETGEWKSR
jgi:hypothetical protein